MKPPRWSRNSTLPWTTRTPKPTAHQSSSLWLPETRPTPAQAETLGQTVEKQDEATALVEKFDAAVDNANAETNGESVFLAVASGNAIDNGAGRIGRIIEPLDLVDVFGNQDLDSESVHQDSGMAP